MAVTESKVRTPRAISNNSCFACGGQHPHGLHLHFVQDADHRMKASWQTDAAWQGFEGVIHGGIVSTVLDEAMSKAVAGAGIRALTCELRVRLRQSVAPDERLEVKGWLVARNRRKISAEATLQDPAGQERAHAWATFLALPETA